MCKRIPWPNRKTVLLYLVVIFDVIKIFLAVSTIIYFGVNLHQNLKFKYIHDYKIATCIPISGRVEELTMCQKENKWIAVWETNTGQIIVDNPFNSKSTRKLAIDDRQDRQLFTNQSCMCRNVNNTVGYDPCNLWSVCIFNVEFIEYLQADNFRNYETNVSFIVGSVIAIILIVATTPMTYIFHKRRQKDYIEI